MNEYLIITGVNSIVNPGNNTFNGVITALQFMVGVTFTGPVICEITYFVDRFSFRTNGDAPARNDFYTFLN